MPRSAALPARVRVVRAVDPLVLALVAVVFFIALKLSSYRSFGVHGEAANFEYMLWSVLRGEPLRQSAVDSHFFSQHFSPILYALAPLYSIFRSPVFLLVLQASVAALAVIPLYWLSRTSLQNRWGAVAIGAAYLTQRHLSYGLMYDFHMEIFYPLLYFSVFLFMERRKWPLFYLFLLLTITVKEDANVANAGLGMFLIAQRQYRHGIATLVLSLSILLVTFGLIFPYFRRDLLESGYQFAHYWTGYGDSIRDVIGGMLDPGKHAEVILTGTKLRKMFTLFANFGFLPLGTWTGALFLVGPNWFMLYSSEQRLLHGPLIYYGLLAIPFLFFSSIRTLRRLQERNWVGARYAVVVGAVVLLLVCLANSRIFQQLRPEAWRRDERFHVAEAMIEAVPSTAAVSAQIDLQAHFPIRRVRSQIPRDIDCAEYLLFDLLGNTYPLSREENRALADSLRGSSDWTVISEDAGFALFHRTSEALWN